MSTAAGAASSNRESKPQSSSSPQMAPTQFSTSATTEGGSSKVVKLFELLAKTLDSGNEEDIGEGGKRTKTSKKSGYYNQRNDNAKWACIG